MDFGEKIWVFPDLDLPPAGSFQMKGHESIIVLNMGEQDAHLRFTFFHPDAPPEQVEGIRVEARRVRCLKTDCPEDFPGFSPARETQYAVCLESDVPVVAQYGRLDTRDQPVAYYTVMGYHG